MSKSTYFRFGQNKAGVLTCCPCREVEPPPEGCDIAADNFDSGDPLSTNWSGDLASFSKAGGELSSNTTDQTIVHNTAHPDGTPDFYVTADLQGNWNNALIRIIVDYVDANNFHYAELRVGTTPRISLFRRENGGDQVLGFRVPGNLSLGVYHTVTVCLQSTGEFYAEVSGTRFGTVTTPFGGLQAGLGTGTLVTQGVKFDNFDFDSSYNENRTECPKCQNNDPNCDCTACIGNITPLRYKVTLAGTGYDGTYIASYAPNAVTDSVCPAEEPIGELCCKWSASITGMFGCTAPSDAIIFHFGLVGGNYIARVEVTCNLTKTETWRTNLGANPVDCTAITDLVLTDSFCSTPGTATVSAL